MIKLRAEERGSVSQYIHSVCGIALDDSKAYLLEGRLANLVEQTGCSSFSQFISRAKSEAARVLERRIVDAITTGETLFFRDTTPFDLLRHKIIPELIDRRARTGSARIRIWSAACSTGQELYSVAMVLKELLGDPDRYGVSMTGTDISDHALSRASKGIFSTMEVSRGLPDDLRAKYFVPAEGGWKIRDELRALATFRKLNLMQDFSALGKFDLIFCRNVAIYFNDADKRMLFQRIERSLEPNGYLIIGAMESLTGTAPQFESKRHLRSVYYQSKSARV